jgi:hypothetical protein
LLAKAHREASIGPIWQVGLCPIELIKRNVRHRGATIHKRKDIGRGEGIEPAIIAHRGYWRRVAAIEFNFSIDGNLNNALIRIPILNLKAKKKSMTVEMRGSERANHI